MSTNMLIILIIRKHSNEKYRLFTIVLANVCLLSICQLIAFLQHLLPLLLVHWLHNQRFDDSQITLDSGGSRTSPIAGVLNTPSASLLLVDAGNVAANQICPMPVTTFADENTSTKCHDVQINKGIVVIGGRMSWCGSVRDIVTLVEMQWRVGIVGVCQNHSVSFEGIFRANLWCQLGVRSQGDWLSRTHVGGAIQAILSPTHDPVGGSGFQSIQDADMG